ncbi:unnamed protein product [Adineta steineri]|uniref:K Homology domain-containing protein n=1 Tax=Adineta steineri TaxID=433720 RepID=A0A813V9L7_9BILA|nr:unnamed protein product [Adineta steineri]CAF1267884.1 unnamed protein product [Adineta steineri]CAF1451108.1 unnamed protein product [Adineta steineri]
MDYTYGQSNDYPLRILVPSDSVGAIIGKQGTTVKQIKQTTHTKVDVNKNESSTSQERIIIIRGQQENCIQACREIFRIMYEDAKNKNRTNEIIVKVLAHNNFIGRIIGKGGNIINTIKKETDTNITVSSINELNSYNIERIISIKGEIEQQIRALETIYGKLCLAYENDNARAWNYSSQYYQQQQQQLMQHFAQQAAMMNPNGPSLLSTHYSQQPQSIIHPTQTNNTDGSSNKYIEQSNANAIYQPTYYPTIFPTSGPFYMPYQQSGPIISSQPNPYVNGNLSHHQQQQQQHSHTLPNASVVVETVHLYVPNTIIGAIIGTKGVFIKSIIKNSNATVKINPPSSDEDQNKIVDRQVTITGTPEAQWKSQYYIYDKIRQEGYAGDDEVRLRAEIFVPTSLIGRLVGKGGHNVRQLQQSTGAIIKLPDDSQQTSASEVPVKIIGSFQASQFAQRRIQSIIQMSRDITTDDANNSNGEQLNPINNNNLNETTTTNVNGSTISDDAVVASSTLLNTDDSLTAADDQKSRDE